MIDWGLSEDQLAALLAGVGRAATDVTDRDEGIARAFWSLLVEPGDSTAGALISSVGAIEATRLMIESPSPRAVTHATDDEIDRTAAARALGRWLPRRRLPDLVRALESAARCGARLIIPADPEWPESLADLERHAPVALWVRGDPGLLRRLSVAIVGARAATGYGEHVAMELAAGAVSRDVVVISGGAYGIDGMAHRAAIASGGDTIAVLAGGVDRLYPAGHEALLSRIAHQGTLVAEVPCGAAPTRWRFLQRNRLIAALGAATIVVEAGRRSGSLSTARDALTLGRPVGAVPGPVTSATSAGCHSLIRGGLATCVTTAHDVMELVSGCDEEAGDDPCSPPQASTEHSGATISSIDPDGLKTRVLDALRPRRGQSVEELARAVGEAPARIRGILGELSLEDRAETGLSGWVRRAPQATASSRIGKQG
jgi:DNA processing protein